MNIIWERERGEHELNAKEESNYNCVCMRDNIKERHTHTICEIENDN